MESVIQNSMVRKNVDTSALLHPNVRPAMALASNNEMRKNLKLALDELKIGRRVQNELKLQGRSVTWLADQLCMERTSLYYVFRQNSIDMELLLRISCHLNHNFLQEVNDVYKAYGL